jgi:hypothetical protein
MGYIAVDLDRTLAHYDTYRGIGHIGDPIAPMVERVKKWLSEGKDVRILTARVNGESVPEVERVAYVAEATATIQSWCIKHIGEALPVTCSKCFEMEVLYDDRAVQVEPNTGRLVGTSKDRAYKKPRTIPYMLAGVKDDAAAIVQQAKDAATAYNVASNGGMELGHVVAGTLSALKVVVDKNTRK